MKDDWEGMWSSHQYNLQSHGRMLSLLYSLRSTVVPDDKVVNKQTVVIISVLDVDFKIITRRGFDSTPIYKRTRNRNVWRKVF